MGWDRWVHARSGLVVGQNGTRGTWHLALPVCVTYARSRPEKEIESHVQVDSCGTHVFRHRVDTFGAGDRCPEPR